MTPPPSRLRRAVLVGGVSVVALVATGVGVAALNGDEPAEGSTATPSVLAGPFAAPANGQQPTFSTLIEALPAPPATPEAAAAAYFAAEAADEFEASFALLAADDRATYGGWREWAAAHDELPIVVAFTPSGPADIDGDDAVVTGRVEFEPLVDEVVGIIPAVAAAEIVLASEDGGWRVADSASIYVPDLPAPEAAVPVAADWVAERQACRTERDGYQGNLLGDPRIEAVLCETAGAFTAGEPGDVDDVPDPTPFLSTFGPDGVAALVSVPFTGPAPLTVVLAPLGATWVVVGVE